LLAGIGILNALARRQVALLLAVFTGVAGMVVISNGDRASRPNSIKNGV
jgi:uncharacterized membrane protein YphA (DoxX/SURF4 family)